jgi:hypothetical protein
MAVIVQSSSSSSSNAAASAGHLRPLELAAPGLLLLGPALLSAILVIHSTMIWNKRALSCCWSHWLDRILDIAAGRCEFAPCLVLWLWQQHVLPTVHCTHMLGVRALR